jgi:hypothetical protein
MQEWMRWEPTRRRRPLASLVLTPARIVVGLGAVVGTAGSILPWAEGAAPGIGGMGPVRFTGWTGAGDGITLLILIGTAGILTVHEAPATSRVRTVRLLPVLLIALAAATLVNGYRAAQLAVAGWERAGGAGQLAPGLWLAAAGVGLMAMGTLPLLPELVRWRPAEGDPADLVSVGVGDVAATVTGILGAVVGGAAGVAFTVSLTDIPVMGLIELGAVFGGVLGAYGGSRLGRLAIDVLRGSSRT